MSELTKCNYCSLQNIKVKAEAEKKRVIIEDSIVMDMMKGKEIYCVPKGENLDKEKHWVCWMMEIPDRCCC